MVETIPVVAGNALMLETGLVLVDGRAAVVDVGAVGERDVEVLPRLHVRPPVPKIISQKCHIHL